VINNRGKELSQLEKMKNYFIYYATVKDRRGLHKGINERWRELQENLSLARLTTNSAEDSFLRHCYLVYFEPNKERSWDVYAQMKDLFPVNVTDPEELDKAVERIEGFVSFVSRAAQYCAWFYRDQEFLKGRQVTEQLTRIDRILRHLRCHPVEASVMPVYLSIMEKTETWADKERLLKALEVLNFRLYVLPRVLPRADSKQGELFELAHSYFHRSELGPETEELVRSSALQTSLESRADQLLASLTAMVLRYCPEVKLVQALTLDQDENENYHRWNGLRYLLACYEEHLNAKLHRTFDIQEILKGRGSFGTLPNDHLSVEHIWAQKNLQAEYPHDHREKRRLGNLVLLGMRTNTSVGNESIPAKVQSLTDMNSTNKVALKLEQITELVHLLPMGIASVEKGRRYKNAGYYHDLARFISDARETELIRFALQRWKLDADDFYRFQDVDSVNAAANRLKEVYRLAPERVSSSSHIEAAESTAVQ